MVCRKGGQILDDTKDESVIQFFVKSMNSRLQGGIKFLSDDIRAPSEFIDEQPLSVDEFQNFCNLFNIEESEVNAGMNDGQATPKADDNVVDDLFPLQIEDAIGDLNIGAVDPSNSNVDEVVGEVKPDIENYVYKASEKMNVTLT